LRFGGGCSVSKDAGQLRDLGEPPPVVLTVDVYPEPHEVILLPLVWSPENTKISSEDCAILANAGFVCFILLLGGLLSRVPTREYPDTEAHAVPADRVVGRYDCWRTLGWPLRTEGARSSSVVSCRKLLQLLVTTATDTGVTDEDVWAGDEASHVFTSPAERA